MRSRAVGAGLLGSDADDGGMVDREHARRDPVRDLARG